MFQVDVKHGFWNIGVRFYQVQDSLDRLPITGSEQTTVFLPGVSRQQVETVARI